jgi:SAM-dependent methyltransferase
MDISDYRPKATMGRLLPHVPERARLVLDLGCGIGAITGRIARLLTDSTVVGLDIERNGLGSCELFDENRELFVQGDGLALPFADETFDVVVVLEVIEHFDRPDPILGEIRRVLRNEGILLISTPNGRSITAHTGKLLFAVQGQRWNAWNLDHKVLYDPCKIREELIRSGFKVVATSGFWPLPEYYQLLPRFFGESRIARRFTQTASDSSFVVRAGFITICIAEKERGKELVPVLEPPN